VTLLAALGNVPPVTRENPVIDQPATVPASEITQTLAAVEHPAASLLSRSAVDADATIEGVAR
jgi:glycine betaine/proline transport system ATP-binding protein